MDALTDFMALTRIEGSLDLRCQMAGRFEMPHAQAESGVAPFHFVLAGTARVEMADRKVITLRAGDFLLLPRGTPHAVQGLGAGRGDKLTLDQTGPLAERYNTRDAVELDLLCGRFTYQHGPAELIMATLPDLLHVSFERHPSMQALSGVVSLLRDEVQALRTGAMSVVTALSQVLFVMAIRDYIEREHIPPSLLGLLGDARFSSAVLAMLRQPQQPWTVDALARQANMSRATFARHFSEKSALSPMDLLTHIRMQLASRLLLQSGSSVGAIAEQVGYQSESAFSKVFKQRMGVTPFAYRRRRVS